MATACGAVLLNGFIVNEREVKTDAFFVNGDWQFAENWRLSLGARLNRERFAYAAVSDLNGALPGVPIGIPTGVPLPDDSSDLLAELLPQFVPPDYDDASPRRLPGLASQARPGLGCILGFDAGREL